MTWKTLITLEPYFQPLLSFELREGGDWVTLKPGLFLKSLCLPAQVLSWWRNNHRYIGSVFLPPPKRRPGSECGLVFSRSTVLSAQHRGLEENGPQECTQNRAKLFRLCEEERKNGEGGEQGEEERPSL
uniref:Uncharacterized protein n=1 Tax=Rousettus aegyptiacus TaxID=9407 RepID=A0A7J8GB34_ROUAE|nr:hypothetical protein HJG63_011720 [Rousettus aegyptiacus]